MVRSLAGDLGEGRLSRRRTFRDPHHSATLQALVGGGARPKPGEVSLAHHGVLFLDELPEFNRATLEALRQPLESGRVTVARANAHVTYPARFQLVAAMNPCRCGHLMDPTSLLRPRPALRRRLSGQALGPVPRPHRPHHRRARRRRRRSRFAARRPKARPTSPPASPRPAPSSASGWPSSMPRGNWWPSRPTRPPACWPTAPATGRSRAATPTPTARFSRPSPNPMPRAAPCWPAPPNASASPPAPGTARSGSRAPWPISTAPTPCAACTSPRRSATAGRETRSMLAA